MGEFCSEAHALKLELRKYKNDSTQSKVAALFNSPYRWLKSAAISKQEHFWTDLIRSYIVLALIYQDFYKDSSVYQSRMEHFPIKS